MLAHDANEKLLGLAKSRIVRSALPKLKIVAQIGVLAVLNYAGYLIASALPVSLPGNLIRGRIDFPYRCPTEE